MKLNEITDPPWIAGVPLVLFVSFLSLRIFGYTDWQWWVVCSPLGGAAVLFGLCVLFFALSAFMSAARRRLSTTPAKQVA